MGLIPPLNNVKKNCTIGIGRLPLPDQREESLTVCIVVVSKIYHTTGIAS